MQMRRSREVGTSLPRTHEVIMIMASGNECPGRNAQWMV
jgi:hypothetical protein